MSERAKCGWSNYDLCKMVDNSEGHKSCLLRPSIACEHRVTDAPDVKPVVRSMCDGCYHENVEVGRAPCNSCSNGDKAEYEAAETPAKPASIEIAGPFTAKSEAAAVEWTPIDRLGLLRNGDEIERRVWDKINEIINRVNEIGGGK